MIDISDWAHLVQCKSRFTWWWKDLIDLLWVHVLKVFRNLIRWLKWIAHSLAAHFCCFGFSNLFWEVSSLKLSWCWVFVRLVFPGWLTYLSITSFHSLWYQVWSVLLHPTPMAWYQTTQSRWRLSTLIFRFVIIITAIAAITVTMWSIFFGVFFMNYKLFLSIYFCRMEVMSCCLQTINCCFCYRESKLVHVLGTLPIWEW